MRFIILSIIMILFAGCNSKRNKISKFDEYLALYNDEAFANRRIEMDKVAVGSFFPDSELFTIENKQIQSKDLLKSPSKFYFWATWCSPCVENIAMIDSLSNLCSDTQQPIYIVSIEEEIEFWSQFIKDSGLTGDHYWMGPNPEKSMYALLYDEFKLDTAVMVVTSLPTIVEIDAQRRIKSKGPKFKNKDALITYFAGDCTKNAL